MKGTLSADRRSRYKEQDEVASSVTGLVRGITVSSHDIG
jgi:hypothetical protein